MPSASPAGVFSAANRLHAIAVVFKAVAFVATPRQWQHPVFAIKRLDSGLLVHAKHRCISRGAQVLADHIRSLELKVWIVGDEVTSSRCGRTPCLRQIRRTTENETPPQFGCQLAAAPERGDVLRFVFECSVQHPGFQLRQRAQGARPGEAIPDPQALLRLTASNWSRSSVVKVILFIPSNAESMQLNSMIQWTSYTALANVGRGNSRQGHWI